MIPQNKFVLTRGLIWVTCLLAFPVPHVWAQDTSAAARAWLEKMSRAAHQTSYEGTFVYLHDKQMKSMRITHIVGADGERERLVTLDGAGREVLRSGHDITCILPDDKTGVARIHPRKAFPYALPGGIDELADYYDFALADQERIAGLAAQRVLVKPKDQYRYGYHLWIDQASNLLLKAAMMNEHDQPVEQLMFTTLTLNPANPAPLAAPAAQDDARSEEHAPRTDSGAKEWRVTRPPQGFKPIEHTKYTMPLDDEQVEHIVLSDGLASVSVFIEKHDDHDKFVGTSYRGAVNAYGIIYQDHQITVVGEVPRATVQLIGQSVERIAP